ncbi:peptidase C14, caspase domain-containing protein, partial [Amanita rubescens]
PPMAPPEGNQTFGPPTAGGNQRFYRYSQCNGKKKALCIGINYIGQENQLGGCINDALNMRNFLCRHYGYKMEDIVLLRDDSQNPKELPTKDNMLRAMQWLVSDPRPNDSLFFHYSGHGGQTQDLNGDEDDGFDEVIYPVDYKKRGHIVDDDLHEIMVKPLPPGCRLTAIFDSCHSGTALDLPYVYSTEGKIKEPNLMAEAGKGALSVFTAYERHNILGAVKGAVDLVKVATGNTRQAQAQRTTRQTKTSPADAISWGGCKDSQTSADTQEAGRATGAMSYAFITSLEQNPQQTYQQLLVNIRNILSGKYSQKPQLSCSHPMDTNILFIC